MIARSRLLARRRRAVGAPRRRDRARDRRDRAPARRRHQDGRRRRAPAAPERVAAGHRARRSSTGAARISAIAGAVSSLPGAFPGVGTATEIGAGLADTVALVYSQVALILAVAAAFDHDLSARTTRARPTCASCSRSTPASRSSASAAPSWPTASCSTRTTARSPRTSTAELGALVVSARRAGARARCSAARSRSASASLIGARRELQGHAPHGPHGAALLRIHRERRTGGLTVRRRAFAAHAPGLGSARDDSSCRCSASRALLARQRALCRADPAAGVAGDGTGRARDLRDRRRHGRRPPGLGGEPVHVRLIGIDTPEIAHFGQARASASASARPRSRARLALGRQVVLQPGRERHDRYGRLLAYVRVAGRPRRSRAHAARARRGAHAGDSAQRRPRRALCRPRGAPRAAPGAGCGAPAALAEAPVPSTPTGGRPATEGPPAPGRVWQPGAANSVAAASVPPVRPTCSVAAATIPIDEALA